ncbi:hypothetical protein [Aggregatibacter actinomycetemcomitans]|uniref:hypothetical protein n=1 Tax=Aggregatibacter actinomycetemcomitans TaxID=714 RepID=UPI00197CA63B|nr:hypothetical protein [Aggregatibacter actinomycetemcomitans]MBN6059374.1 hypothetical protein [Aggregatibacter actinomycetemcomitans]MBN6087875.1 hypothetical protein [Aggregatibacter actinomycetemcomitans]
MTKTPLTKANLNKKKSTSLSIGLIEKDVMSVLKEDVVTSEFRTTVMLPVDVYKAAKQYAVSNDMKLKDYFTALLRKDLEEKGML